LNRLLKKIAEVPIKPSQEVIDGLPAVIRMLIERIALPKKSNGVDVAAKIMKDSPPWSKEVLHEAVMQSRIRPYQRKKLFKVLQ